MFVKAVLISHWNSEPINIYIFMYIFYKQGFCKPAFSIFTENNVNLAFLWLYLINHDQCDRLSYNVTKSAFKVNESFMMEYAAIIFIKIKSIHTVMGNRKSLKGATFTGVGCEIIFHIIKLWQNYIQHLAIYRLMQTLGLCWFLVILN